MASPMRHSPYPKRKRAEVSYYEDGLGESSEDEQHLSQAAPAQKKQKPPPTPPKRKIFPFLSLPAELRNKVYQFALTNADEAPVYLESALRYLRHVAVRPLTGKPPKVRTIGANLLCTNQEIFKEALPILYGVNKFQFEDPTALHHFLAGIGTSNCAFLRDVTIVRWGEGRSHKAMNHPAMTLLGAAINLQRLKIESRIGWSGHVQGYARQLFRDGSHFFDAYGRANGRKDAGVDIIDIGGQNLSSRYSWANRNEEDPGEDELKKRFQTELRYRISWR